MLETAEAARGWLAWGELMALRGLHEVVSRDTEEDTALAESSAGGTAAHHPNGHPTWRKGDSSVRNLVLLLVLLGPFSRVLPPKAVDLDLFYDRMWAGRLTPSNKVDVELVLPQVLYIFFLASACGMQYLLTRLLITSLVKLRSTQFCAA